MGVSGGNNNLLDYTPKKIGKNGNYDKYIVIDARFILYKFCIGYLNSGTYVADKKGKNILEIYYLFKIALTFLSDGIIPIFVFDGDSPECKNDTLDKRKISKDKANEMCNNIIIDAIASDTMNDDDSHKASEILENADDISDEKHSTIKEYIKYKKRSFHLDKKNIEVGKTLLQFMGVPIINAPGEADPQCATILNAYPDKVIGVLTDDFDPLMFGASNIAKISTLTSSHIDVFTLDDTLTNLELKIKKYIDECNNETIKQKYGNKTLHVTHETLIDIGCLIGTNYCKGIKTNKTKKYDKLHTVIDVYVKNDFSFENVLKHLSYSNINGTKNDNATQKTSKASECNDDYISRLRKAKHEYYNALVRDPFKIDISFNEPLYVVVKHFCSEFLTDESIDEAMKILEKASTEYNKKKINHSKIKSILSSSTNYIVNDTFNIINNKTLNVNNTQSSTNNNGDNDANKDYSSFSSYKEKLNRNKCNNGKNGKLSLAPLNDRSILQ
jgi:5'-3' exonuclease